MKRIKYLLFASVLFASCSSSKILTSDVKPIEITEMLKIEPFSYITLIEKGNKGIYNDSISNITKLTLNESIESFREKLWLSSQEVIITDSTERNKLEKELSFLILSADRSRNIKNLPITPMIDSLLTANNQRFGLVPS